MIKYNPLLCTDGYKLSHAQQYPKNLTKIVEYYIPRMSRIDNIDKLTLFGLQGFIKEYLVESFNNNFFNQDIEEVIKSYLRYSNSFMNIEGVGEENLRKLHSLGYLPLEIRALPEGTRSNIKVPQIEISNTHPDFIWLVGNLETLLSDTMWHTQVSAEVGYRYRQIVNKYYDISCDTNKVERARLLSDFSMRGQESVESATKSSASFLLSFLHTATLPSIIWLEDYYNCDINKDKVGYSAISTEHSVMCINTAIDKNETDFVKRLLLEVYPNKSFSMVSDSYDYWNMVENILPSLKNEIMNHNGYIGIRGDSGDPIEIVTQTVFKLWESFGGTVNSKGFKVLDNHIKVIYGDSITPYRCEKIYEILTQRGFCISNVSLGVGSFSMQCLEEVEEVQPITVYPYARTTILKPYTQERENLYTLSPFTRDTFGIAVKATYAEDDNGNHYMILKDPKTDTGNFKKSHKGCCRVIQENGEYSCIDNLTWGESQENNLLQTVFKNGKFVKEFTLNEIRNNLHKGDFYDKNY